MEVDEESLFESSNLGESRNFSPVPNSTVAVFYNATRLSRARSRFVHGVIPSYEISDAATATTLTKGTVPAGGTLVLQLKKPGRNVLVSCITTGVDAYGEYTFRLFHPKKYPRGKRFRVALTDCVWCTNASTSGTL